MTTITNNKLPEWRTELDKCVENYQSTRAWYEENRDSPAALDDMERAEDQLANFVRKCGFSIVLGLLDEMDELQELRRNYLALRGEIEDVRSQLYEAEKQANEYASELQEHRKAAAELVLYVMGMGYAFDAETASTCKGAVDSWVGEWNQERLPGQEEYKTVPLYTAPPASERERIRREHAEWSDATFGDVGPVGPLKHLSKEALEAAADPSDPLEWADMQFLLWDAQRRMGISDEFITRAMVEKLAINKARKWPEPKDGEPRLHIKEQPVPVVRQIMRELVSLLDEDQFARIENIALSAGVMPPQPAPVVPEEITSASAPEVFEITAEAERLGLCGTYASYAVGWNACRAAMLQGKFRDLSQPVDPQVTEYEQIMLQAGWVMVPVEPTDEMIAAAMECDDVVFDSKDPTAFCVQYREIYYAMVDVAPKPENI
ncbi:TPA: dATP/dGTP pyrophosphohydrolase domain-containing protein [Salmonella enterica subsp. enterica serovar Dublin]